MSELPRTAAQLESLRRARQRRSKNAAKRGIDGRPRVDEFRQATDPLLEALKQAHTSKPHNPEPPIILPRT